MNSKCQQKWNLHIYLVWLFCISVWLFCISVWLKTNARIRLCTCRCVFAWKMTLQATSDKYLIQPMRLIYLTCPPELNILPWPRKLGDIWQFYMAASFLAQNFTKNIIDHLIKGRTKMLPYPHHMKMWETFTVSFKMSCWHWNKENLLQGVPK